MPRFAVVVNNKVINVVEAATQGEVNFISPQPIQIPDGLNVSINWTYDGSIWTAPVIVVPVPHEVTMRQARIALYQAGLLTEVATAINALSEPTKTLASIEWEYSNTLIRSNPFVATLGAALGLSSSQIDDLFIAAAQIS